jgi:hypothetical protein
MTSGRFTRREMLLGASAATLVGLTGCESSTSSFLSGAAGSPMTRFSPFSQRHMSVSEPTGTAIQAAIDELGSKGGSIYLTAHTPYVIKKTLLIPYNNINLIGRGWGGTQLVAQRGAVLTTPGYTGEYLLLITSANDISVTGMGVDLVDEDNSSGNPRCGIGAWGSTSIKVMGLKLAHNLGPNGFNQSLSFNQCTDIHLERVTIDQSRTGISFSKCSDFVVSQCQIRHCEAEAPSYGGPLGAVSIVSSTDGIVKSSFIKDNSVNGAIYINDGASLRIDSVEILYTQPSGSRGNDGVLIEASSGRMIIVDRTTIAQSSGSGVAVNGSSNVMIRECTIVNSGQLGYPGSGINLDGGTDHVQILGNHISNSRFVNHPGVVAGNTSKTDTDGHVVNNLVHGFGTGVELGTQSQGFVVEDNDLSKNKACYTNNGSGNKIENNLC